MPEGDYRNLTFEHYDGSDGLVNSMVQSIVEDREGKLWVATEYGISRLIRIHMPLKISFSRHMRWGMSIVRTVVV